MSTELLSDDQIAVLSDIGQGSSSFDEEKKHELVHLLVRGYIERNGSLLRITKLGQQALADRLARVTDATSS